MTIEFLIPVIIAGILGTYVLLVMALWSDRLGLPRLDFAKVMAALTYGESFDGPPPYFAGQIIVYLNGIFFGLLYASVVYQYLPFTPLLDGLAYGVILWAVSGLMYVPLFLREGFFLSKVHPMAWAGSLIAHSAYGLMVGWISPTLG